MYNVKITGDTHDFLPKGQGGGRPPGRKEWG